MRNGSPIHANVIYPLFNETFRNMGYTGRHLNWKIMQEILPKAEPSKVMRSNINSMSLVYNRGFYGHCSNHACMTHLELEYSSSSPFSGQKYGQDKMNEFS